MTSKLIDIAAEVLEVIYSRQSSFKTSLYNTTKRHKLKTNETKQVFAICAQVVKNKQSLNKLTSRFLKISGMTKSAKIQNSKLHPYLYELLVSKSRKKPKNDLADTILKHKDKLSNFVSELDFERKPQKASPTVYARINRLSIKASSKSFQDKFFPNSSVDVNLPDLLVIKSEAKDLHENKHVKNHDIILQDKASCIPPLVMFTDFPRPELTDSIMIDGCSAPGNKTTQLASLLQQKGLESRIKLLATEKDRTRFEILKATLLNHSAIRVKPYNVDYLEFTKSIADDIEYCLLDPSCSGSGMMQKQTLDVEPASEERVKNLAEFQHRIIKHSIETFKNLKKVVYSTCSIHKEENEYVVAKILDQFPDWKLQNAHDAVKLRGWADTGISGRPEIDDNVIRLSGSKHNTQGFFVASFIKK